MKVKIAALPSRTVSQFHSSVTSKIIIGKLLPIFEQLALLAQSK